MNKINQILISNLDSTGIYNLLEYSPEPQKVIDILLNNQILISNLDSSGIYRLLEYSREPQKVREILKKYRPDLNI